MAPRIMLVDDDRTILAMYGDYLKSHGYEVVSFSSALDAVEALDGEQRFDLVITDIMMAKMDGWQFLATIRKDLGFGDLELPVIVVSAFESDTLEAMALGRGANGSFVKGGDPLSRLLKMVRIQTGTERSKYSDTGCEY